MQEEVPSLWKLTQTSALPWNMIMATLFGALLQCCLEFLF